MNYTAMGIVLTTKCGATCDHCCFSCTPKSAISLPYDLVISCIRGTARIPEISQIGFTGGEPFLLYDQLVEYVAEATKNGKTSTVVTNCQWASEYEVAYSHINKLKKAGLVGIGISYDGFHHKYIPITNVGNVIKAAKRLGLAVKVQAAILGDTKIGHAVDELLPYIVDADLSFFACQPVGRAKEKFASNRFIRDTPSCGGFCRKSGTFSIGPDGTVFPCCVPYAIETELSPGNIYDMSIEDIYRSLENNVYLKLLRNNGFDYFIRIAEKYLDIRIPEKVISPCEICALLFSSKNFYKFLPYLRKEEAL